MSKKLTAIMAVHLKRDAKEDKKRSMLSRLAPEVAECFDLLSAKDWSNFDPKMNFFLRELISNKDSHQASGIMMTQTARSGPARLTRKACCLSSQLVSPRPTSKNHREGSRSSCSAPSRRTDQETDKKGANR
jgi:hypothetical protein